MTRENFRNELSRNVWDYVIRILGVAHSALGYTSPSEVRDVLDANFNFDKFIDEIIELAEEKGVFND